MVAEARAEKAQQERRITEYERDNDQSIGSRTRLLLGIVMGSIWTLSPVVFGLFSGMRDSHLGLIYSTGLFLLVGMGITWWARDSMMKTKINRQLILTVTFALVAQMIMILVCGIRGVSLETSMILNFFLWFVVSGLVNLVVERQFWIATVGYLVALFASTYLPDYRYWIMSASHMVLTLNILWVWGPQAFEKSRSGQSKGPVEKST